MRNASLHQSSPTARAKTTISLAGDTHGSEGTGNGRLMKVDADEQAWGSVYMVELDNADEALNGKNYEGYEVTLNMTFDGETADDFPPLWVHSQKHISREGKLLLELTCVDVWTLLEAINVSYTGVSYNQEWQTEEYLDQLFMPDEETMVKDVPELYNDLLDNGDKTIWEIVHDLASQAGVTVSLDDIDDYIQTLKPPLRVNNARTGIKQAMDMTNSYLRWTDNEILRVIEPAKYGTVYSFNTLDLFYSDAHEVAVSIPNRIIVWAYNADGSDWISGTAVDSTSYNRLGRYIDRHYYVATLDSKNTRTQSELDTMAAGYLERVQGERSQGTVVAPMHVSLELFDQVEVVDSRYSISRTITGYVHRMRRTYDRGIYSIAIQLGGVTSGYTPPGGDEAPGMAEPSEPVSAVPEVSWMNILPRAIQGYTHDIEFTAEDHEIVSWTAGTIKFYDGTEQSVNAGSETLPDGSPPPIMYIYFDLESGTPEVLKVIDSNEYLGILTEYTSILCVAQRALTEERKAIVLPGKEKQPLIVTDMIHMAGLREWTFADGTQLQGIYSTEIQAGYLKLTANTEYASVDLDPTKKRQVFQNTPSPPYYYGDIWVDGDTFKRCTNTRESGYYYSGDWTTVDLDSIADSYNFRRVNRETVTAAGYIYLSRIVEDGGYELVEGSEKAEWNSKNKTFRQSYEPTSGMSTGDIWFDTSDGDKPYTWTGSQWMPSYTVIKGGYIKTGTIDCSKVTIQNTGDSPAIILNASGITVYGEGYLKFVNSNGSYPAYIQVLSSGNMQISPYSGKEISTPKMYIGDLDIGNELIIGEFLGGYLRIPVGSDRYKT